MMNRELIHALIMEPFYIIQLITCWNLLPQKRNRIKNLFFISSIFCFLLIFYNFILFNKGFIYATNLTFFIFTIPGFILYFIISKYRDGRLIFCYFFTDSILSIVNFIVYTLCLTFLNEFSITYILTRNISLIVFAVIFNVLYIPKIRETLPTKEVNWNIIALVSFFAGVYIYYELITKGSILDRQDERFSISLTFILLAIVFLTLLWTLVKIKEKEQQKIELLKKENSLNLIRIQLKQVDSTYEQINETYEKIKMLKHDFKKELAIIDSLCIEGNIEKIKTYLNKIEKKVPEKHLIKYSNNHMLNSIVNYYKYKIENLKIKLELSIKIDLDNDLIISDICLLIANALDNAIEATKNIKEKNIILKINQEKNFIVISIKNSFNPSNIKLENNKLISTKKDLENHGLGLKIIENITKIYNGNCMYTTDKDEFRLDIWLYI